MISMDWWILVHHKLSVNISTLVRLSILSAFAAEQVDQMEMMKFWEKLFTIPSSFLEVN